MWGGERPGGWLEMEIGFGLKIEEIFGWFLHDAAATISFWIFVGFAIFLLMAVVLVDGC